MRFFIFLIISAAFFVSCEEENIIVDALLIEANNILPNSNWELIDTLDSDSLHNGWNVNLSFFDTTGSQLSWFPAGVNQLRFEYTISKDANYSDAPLLRLISDNNSIEHKYLIRSVSSSELLLELVKSSQYSFTEDVFVYYEAD